MKKLIKQTLDKSIYLLVLTISLVVFSCSSNKSSEEDAMSDYSTEESSDAVTETTTDGVDKGVGPITSLSLEDINETMAHEGEELFTTKCSACHKIDKRFVGPALAGFTERRAPEWIMNMILNPEVMVEQNEAAKALLAEYLSPMANQNLTEEEARKILEYFRLTDKK